MNKNATLVFHPDNSSLNNTEHTDIPELDTQTANQLLDNVFAACDMEPSVVPVEVLESWEIIKSTASISDGLWHTFS